jgi:phage terminase large subunit
MNNSPVPAELAQYIQAGLDAGCPQDQMEFFARANIVLQQRQLQASAAARLCDKPDGPTAVGFGGGRGGGKSHWLMAQLGADDCQRYPGLKCLLLRKSGKTNRESIDDLRQRLFTRLDHKYNATNGILTFANGSRIFAKHYQHEKEITESFLGLEYDVVAIEEATTLTPRKHQDIATCCRTSKPDWRPRIYSTTNPSGVSHDWYFQKFIVPFRQKRETSTRFIEALLTDNIFTNPDYIRQFDEIEGWRKGAWLHGDWNIQSGQYFKHFRPEIHVTDSFNEYNAVEWFAAMDYGYTHYTVILLGCYDHQGNLHVLDEHAARGLIPAQHVRAAYDMFLRHKIVLVSPKLEAALADAAASRIPICDRAGLPNRYSRRLSRMYVGSDLFAKQYDGNTIADLFRDHGIRLSQANTNRVQGWTEILHRLGAPDDNIPPTLFIHPRCERLINTLPYLQHDPANPADLLKSNPDEEGLGGDDAADCLRYLVASKARIVHQVKLRGL